MIPGGDRYGYHLIRSCIGFQKKSRFSETVISSFRYVLSETIPILDFTVGLWDVNSGLLKKDMEPDDGLSEPDIILRIVVFPAPLLPKIATVWASLIDTLKLLIT